ncbi:MAG: biotin--[acetyl-CoA-carboxylase] ligase [Clostridia bacterium]|nr:biotin--[acetyl-CoA-carboxylase] ligase [Clostridia bacterium]
MKIRVLNQLRKDCSAYVSGEMLSGLLGVSRTAVWKTINELRKDGYKIESSSKKGYKLISAPDVLSTHEIGHNLETKVIGRNIEYFNSIDSTNNYAKKIANEGCAEGTVIVAENQTAGRGRLGRAWNSPDKKGIWMSVVLHPAILPGDVGVITLAAAVAVVDALKRAAGIKAGIKWPNDIILDGKKVCGILTEMNAEMERINFVVIGIGLNVNQAEDDFPEELRDRAVSLKSFSGRCGADAVQYSFNRCEIIKEVLLQLENIYNILNQGKVTQVIDLWKNYSETLGKEVLVTLREQCFRGVAKDISTDGKLIVACDDGVVREFVSGEISVRGIMGYI